MFCLPIQGAPRKVPLGITHSLTQDIEKAEESLSRETKSDLGLIRKRLKVAADDYEMQYGSKKP